MPKRFIKKLDRHSPGNCIVNNTIWKDLEFYAIRHPKSLMNEDKLLQ